MLLLTKIMKKLKDPLTTDDKKSILRKEYAKTIYDNHRAIYELMNELKENNNDYVKVKEEEITIMNEIDIKDKKDKKDKKEKKEKKKKDKPKKLTKEGKKWAKAAVKDMKERENN